MITISWITFFVFLGTLLIANLIAYRYLHTHLLEKHMKTGELVFMTGYHTGAAQVLSLARGFGLTAKFDKAGRISGLEEVQKDES